MDLTFENAGELQYFSHLDDVVQGEEPAANGRRHSKLPPYEQRVAISFSESKNSMPLA